MDTNKPDRKSVEEARVDTIRELEREILLEKKNDIMFTEKEHHYLPLIIIPGKCFVDFSADRIKGVLAWRNAFYLPLIESRADLAFAPLKPGNEIASEHKAILYPIPIISSWDFKTAETDFENLIHQGFERFFMRYGSKNGEVVLYEVDKSYGDGRFYVKGGSQHTAIAKDGDPISPLLELMNGKEANLFTSLLQRYNFK